MENKAKTIIFFFCISLFFCVFQTDAFAKEYTVCSSGCNYSKIQDAANIAQAGDVVKIKPGTYNETVAPKNSGSNGLPITYQKDGTSPVVIVGQSYTTFNIYGKSWLVVDGLTINGNGLSNAVRINNGSNNVIKNCDISNGGVAVSIYSGASSVAQYGISTQNNTITGNKIHDTVLTYNTGEGIYIKNYMPYDVNSSYTNNTLVENNTIFNVYEAIQNTASTITADGTLIDGGITPTNTKIIGNTLTGNHCEQGVVSASSDGFIVEHNLIYNNLGTGSRCSLGIGGKNVRVRYNVLYNNTGTNTSRNAINIKEATGEISNNTIVNFDNRGIGINYTGTPPGTLVIKNNLITNIANQQIYPNGDMSQLILDYNVYGKTGTDLGTHYNVFADPKYINSTDPLNSNFLHPESNSPACKAGEGGTYVGAFPCGGSTTPQLKAGDVNKDGVVDILDIGIVVDNFKKNPITNPQADLDKNGVVDIVDLGIVVDNYGK